MIDRDIFFKAVREKPFGGTLSQEQVDGMNIILDAWDRSGLKDTRWLAYMLATAYHETAHSMQPVEEGYYLGSGAAKFQKGLRYYPYFGRGFVQLTWKANYQKAKDLFGVDFVGQPDLALRPDLAAKIMFSGMTQGWFTGKKLADYITSAGCDYKNARRIINGTDKAAVIAGYAQSFEVAIKVDASAVPPPPDVPGPEPIPVHPPDYESPPTTSKANGVWAWIVYIFNALVRGRT